ncbi:MAG: poly-beta-1,6-N-acetyl-D-glucosamine biosynthesis protein PgaD [Thermodesulfobacteriota bacterium]
MPEVEIIDNPKFKSLLRNVGEWSFTTFMWALWLYLLLPLLNIILWLLGIHFFRVEVFEKAGYLQLLNLAAKMGWIILAVFVVLRSWGYYNYFRFGKKNRRQFVSATSAQQLSQAFHVSPEQVEELQAKKEATWPI